MKTKQNKKKKKINKQIRRKKQKKIDKKNRNEYKNFFVENLK